MNEVVDEIYENETAEELYERFQREKERLISEGKLKKQKKLPEISEDEIPFKIPKSWKWVRLGEVTLLMDGIYIENVQLPYLEVKYLRGKIEAKMKNSGKYVEKNQHLILVDGENSGEIFLTKEEGILGSTFKLLKILFNYDKYIIHFLNLYKEVFKSNKKGAAIPHLDKDLFKMFVIPLPPLSEQKRISELIDRLFKKLDEAKEKALSTLNTFELRKAKILHLAIQGKLSKQLDEYETAEELYEKIQIEKEKLISEGKLKKQKKLPEISEDEIPFEIPKSWKWLRLGELSDTKDNSFADGPFGSNLKKEHYINEPEVRIIQISNIGEEGWKNENVKYTSFIHAETIKRSMVSCGDIVITKMMPAGRAIQVPDIEKNYILSSDVIKFVPHPLINRKYLLYSINSNVFKNQIYDEVQGITRVRTSLMKIKSYLIPLPPLEEQKEIVKLLDNIFEKEEKAKKLIESILNKIELIKKSILARAVRGKI